MRNYLYEIYVTDSTGKIKGYDIKVGIVRNADNLSEALEKLKRAYLYFDEVIDIYQVTKDAEALVYLDAKM